MLYRSKQHINKKKKEKKEKRRKTKKTNIDATIQVKATLLCNTFFKRECILVEL